jgi:PAS domain S-box-containing protein
MKNSISYKIGLVVVSTLTIMLFSMLAILLFNEENLKIESTLKSVSETDEIMRKSITFAMNEGATDLDPFKESISQNESIVELKITPTNLVEEGAEENLDSVEKETLKSLESKFYEEEFNNIPVFRSVVVIKSAETCVDCHDIPVGDPMVVISGRYSMADTYEAIYSQRLIALIMAIVTIVIIFFILMYYVKKKIVSPIVVLNESAKKVRDGEVNVQVDVIDETEIGQLSSSFNKMVEKIAIQIGYLEKIPTPIMIIDKEFSIEYMNLAGAAVIGSDQKSLFGKKCYDQFKTDQCKTEKCALSQAMAKDTVVTEETTAHPNGNELQIMYTGAPLKDKDGNITGALEYVADVSEIKDRENYLTRSTETILEAMDKFSNGDLTSSVIAEREGDDIARLFNGFNKTCGNIKSIISQVKDSVEATASASTQISSSAEEMAAGAQEQSSQTAEVAAAIEEMSRTVVETANNTTLTEEASQEANKKAIEGASKVELSKKGMERIVSSTETVGNNISSLTNKTEQIGEIAQVIDDIADQTNLLALNAAIEAARAGEHGRGFAVVADEVRKLAENTTKATKEIAETIRAIQTEGKEAGISMKEAGDAVQNGLLLNEEVGEVLNAIIASVGNVTSQIGQVAAASEEQSATAEQVSTNIEAINNVANESAVGIQQIASASEDLNRLTENLSSLVEKFKMDKGVNCEFEENVSLIKE